MSLRSRFKLAAVDAAFPKMAQMAMVVLVCAGLSIAAVNEHFYREQRAREAGVQAQILADSIAAALAFDDAAAAQDQVDALAANPDVQFVGAYNHAGRLLGMLSRGGEQPPTNVSPHPPMFDGGHVVVTTAVSEGGAPLGVINLRLEVEPWSRRIARYAGVALLVGMALIAVIVLAGVQVALARANRELAAKAADVAQAYARLQAEIAERHKTEEALRQSQKMEAIGRLTGGVAHDFNNLLMVASSGLDLMDRTEDPARRARLKDAIRQAVDRGASLTNQLLAFSRQRPLTTEVIDLPARVAGMSNLLERSLREDIGVKFELDDNVWPIEADPNQLEIAILNIAVNARDAMPGGGVITITARNAPGVTDGALNGDYVRLTLRDTGAGMSKDMTHRVFEPFFTTKGLGKGTGLGLSQVFGFSRACGGDVRIDSMPGQGTAITLLFPRSRQPLTPPPPVADPNVVRPLAHGRILLVEDDESVAEMASDLLKSLGYEVVHASHAAQALTLIEHGGGFDLVFSDMLMPGELNGIELAREIGRRWSDLPVVLTTGFSEAAAEAGEEGLPLLLKPYRVDALAHAVGSAIGTRN